MRTPLTFSKCRILGCIAVFALGISSAHAGPSTPTITLHPVVMTELNQILRVSEGLHKALVSQVEEQTEISIRDVIWQIDRVRSVVILAKAHERGHLLRILESAREQLELTQTAYGDERRDRLQEAFNQLVNIVRIYKVDPAYQIFFCAKDKSSWVQKGKKPLNPFQPETLKGCGALVAK